MARRAQARRTKQWTDTEWKEQVLEKLGKVDELVVITKGHLLGL